MTKPGPRNLAASIHRRLLNGARARDEDPAHIVQRYAAERFLYRLGESAHRHEFVLKGGALFALWGGPTYRPTRDLDFTGYGDSDPEGLLERFRQICSLQVADDDGMTFDVDTLRADPIRHELEYGGIRMTFQARLGTVQIRMQVDVGFGNAIEPGARDADYPNLLDAPRPRIRTYPLEAVVAEKLHAMVLLGERNSRYKDFYDLYVLASSFAFDGDPLGRSVRATFERRRTTIVPSLPKALTPAFHQDLDRATKWRAYLKRHGLPGAPADTESLGERLRSFLGPVWESAATGTPFDRHWPAGGPWRAMDTTPRGDEHDA